MKPTPSDVSSQRCTAHSKSGRQCSKWAIKGSTVCNTHGGSAPQVKAAAQRRETARVEEQKALTIIEQYGTIGDPIHPMEVLLHKVWVAHYMERYFAALVQKLADEQAIIDTNFVKLGTQVRAPHVFVQLHGEWADRAARYSKDALSANIDERQVRLAESQSRWIADVIRGGLKKLGLPEAEQTKIIEAIATEMNSVPAEPVRKLAA